MEKEQREMNRIAYVFEKFLYGKSIENAGYTAEGLRVVWLDGSEGVNRTGEKRSHSQRKTLNERIDIT